MTSSSTNFEHSRDFGPEVHQQLTQAFNYILFEGQGRALVNVGALNQELIAETLTKGNSLKLTVAEVMEKRIEDSDFLVITQYSNSLSQSEEDSFQRSVRAASFRNMNLKFVILSDSLPKEHVFDMDLPWFNGPFEEKVAFSLYIQGQNIIVQRFERAGGGMSLEPISWAVSAKEVFSKDC